MSDVVVIDFGMGNLKSVQRGLEKVGATVRLCADPEMIASADFVVLPGVGAFQEGMRGLAATGVIDAIYDFVQTGKPLLGICLGMQMLMETSHEFGIHEGLGLIPGTVEEIPKRINGVDVRKIPHIGWSAILQTCIADNWKHTVLANTPQGEFFYFVHSFMAVPVNGEEVLAYCEYDGLHVNAAIHKDNITGVQFHPEKSGEVGLRILETFLQS